ncbi:MAG: DUF1492 domain-containing protein [Christensenellales bacterium]|jgi:hypothetical protein
MSGEELIEPSKKASVKEWLSRGLYVDTEIKVLIKAKEKQIYSVLGVVYPVGRVKVQGGEKERKTGQILDGIELEDKINAKIDELYDIKQEIYDVVELIENPLHRSMLIARYCQCLKWSDVADLIGRSEMGGSFFELHDRALISAEAVLRKKKLIE